MIVDCGVYTADGRLHGRIDPVDALARARDVEGFVWLGLFEPEPAEFELVATSFGLHPLAVEDAIHAHQRTKFEHYGDSLFLVLKPARYIDSNEVVELGQIMVFVGRDFVVSVRHGSAGDLSSLRAPLDTDAESRSWGVGGVLHAIADRVVDDYDEVMGGLEDDIDQIEVDVFSMPRGKHAERIFRLKREVLDFRRAVDALVPAMARLVVGDVLLDSRLEPYFRDVQDHTLRIADRLHAVDALLDSALHANVAQVGVRQNEDMRKISAWVAIMAVPTMIAGIYGMNFDHMPELSSRVGYPAVLGLMLVACYALYRNFRRRDWL